jgi:hypothetical protein
MPTLKYPSEQFPGPPSVTVEIPDGWSPVRVPGTLLAARRNDTGGRFAPNVVVGGFTRSGDFTIGRALAELKSYVEDRTGGEMDAPFALEIESVPFVGVNVSWKDEAVGDVGGEQVDVEYDSLQQLMQTVRIAR